MDKSSQPTPLYYPNPANPGSALPSYQSKNADRNSMDLKMQHSEQQRKPVVVERIAPSEQPSKRRKIRMQCFQCNRPEGHHIATRSRILYSFAVGLTFGLALLFGPYQCQCCGATRLMCRDDLNIRYWLRHLRDRRASER